MIISHFCEVLYYYNKNFNQAKRLMMTSNTLNNNHHPNNYDPQRAKKAALSSFAGAVVDWYDFLLYGLVAALVFKTQFFPSIDPNMGTLAALATFGVGFLFRPLGGIVFGHYGDKLGRKKRNRHTTNRPNEQGNIQKHLRIHVQMFG